MSRKRKPVTRRSIASRVLKWYRKMDPEVYAIYLTRTKDFAVELFTEYQAVHEYIISVVKDVLKDFPEESARAHAYVWFAQGVWYCTRRYKDSALLKEVNALFTYWYMLGLKEEPLRIIAERLGVKIPDWDIVLEPVAMPVSNIVRTTVDNLLYSRNVYKAVDKTLNMLSYLPPVIGEVGINEKKEYTLIDSYIFAKDVLHVVEGFIDASRSNVPLIFRQYVRVHPKANYVLYYEELLDLESLKTAIYIHSRPSVYGIRITVEPYTTPVEPFYIYYSLYIAKL